MSYSARQLHCLNVLGLVAWSNGRQKKPEIQVDSKPEIQAEIRAEIQPQAPASEQLPAEQAAAVCSSIHDRVIQLPSQVLFEFTHRGAVVDCVGNQSAPLLAVCLLDGTASQAELPMSSECMQLFDLMMRSIALTRSDIRLCAVAEQPAQAMSGQLSDRRLSSLITPQSGALLLLDTTLGSDSVVPDEGADADHTRLPEMQLPVWRVPHPELLLKNPGLKRRAWQNLKALKSLLHAQHQL